jgi:hypothetical protein
LIALGPQERRQAIAPVPTPFKRQVCQQRHSLCAADMDRLAIQFDTRWAEKE